MVRITPDQRGLQQEVNLLRNVVWQRNLLRRTPDHSIIHSGGQQSSRCYPGSARCQFALECPMTFERVIYIELWSRILLTIFGSHRTFLGKCLHSGQEFFWQNFVVIGLFWANWPPVDLRVTFDHTMYYTLVKESSDQIW